MSFQIPKLFKKSFLKNFSFERKNNMFSLQLQYKVSFLSVFTSWVTFLGHLVWMTHNKFFFQRKNFDPLSGGIATETILFFLYWGNSFTLLLSTNWEKFYGFFFFNWTRKLRLNHLPPSICQNPWK